MTKVVAPEVGLQLTLLDTHSYSGLGQSRGSEAQMKLLLRGWDRYELDHTLIDNDISKAKSLEPDIAPGDCSSIRPLNALGELGIVAKAENVSLSGNFHVTIRLTKDEIANLARIAFGKDPFADVVDALSRKEHR